MDFNYYKNIADRVENSEVSIDEILNNSQSVRQVAGVYSLLYRGEVVYVGKGVNVMGRIASHLEGSKVFDSFYYIESDDPDTRSAMESHYVIKYRPKYNAGSPPKSDLLKKVGQVALYFGVHYTKVRRYIHEYKIGSYDGFYRITDFDPELLKRF